MINYIRKIFTRNIEVDSDFVRFFRETPSAARKRVFMEAIRRATKDQQEIMNN